MQLKPQHKGCGGWIVNRKCTKCGKKWSKLKYIFASDVENVSKGFDVAAYKKRLRSGKDLYK